MKFKDEIVFDTETTGLLNPTAIELEKQPHIIELFMLRIDKNKKVIDEYESFFSVPVDLPKQIQKITNITPSMLEGQPVFAKERKKITEFFMGTRTLVAHNAPFDAGMLWSELSRLGMEFHFPWPPNHYCTIEKSFHLENKRLKLTVLHEMATGSPHDNGAHRARADVMALLRCYEWMIEEGM